MDKIYQRLSKYISKTPLVYNTRLSNKYNCNVYLKREDLQKVRSFKIRGALNKILENLDHIREEDKPIVCASAGNHAQGVAYSSKLLEIPSYIFIPNITPRQKVNRIKHFGGDKCQVFEVGNNFDECLEYSIDFRNKIDSIYIHPFDDYDVILGQSTLAFEIHLDLTPDIILSPIGGGGLISGLLEAKNISNLNYDIYGVEPYEAQSMKKSIQVNRIVNLDNIDTFVDGASVKRVGNKTFEICNKNRFEIFTVSNGRLSNELITLYQEDGIIAEPAGALSICGLDYLDKNIIKDKTIVCILSGGNNDMLRYPDILERNMRYLGLKHYFIINFKQKSGELKKYLQDVLPKNVDITRFEYIKKTNSGSGSVLIGLEIENSLQLKVIKKNMYNCHFEFIEINENNLLYNYLI